MASSRGATDGHEDQTSLTEKIRNWGTSSLPPAIHGILITALHARPLQPLPLLMAPALLFGSYVSLAGFPTDAAGITCAWSGIYTLLALRRKQRLRNKFTVRGGVRAGAITLGLANSVAGGFAYTTGDRKRDELERQERGRWGN
ncbi:hypothetical protein SODALDRAFT_329408 [Sodiomyces alkalinus F11]|uniref:Altered inheritance of mitochondria protein 19 n=1 Tax=Sodiomyces alkalinus (strain CBS 110278 / VKM F-3762 / F11) TaxID=1314773 RepID=A0A3N2PL22_SODAK|nr:hypothetical protein SODALDRAFT_329408 [Sodiomyces alkalinus F11]ROT35223.1 hypothetical protein SODALDRAFT_329408 [Sodiomyces alkalinus F11]